MAMACSTHAPELGVGLWDEVKKERDTLGRPALHIIFCRSWLRFCSRHSKAAGTTKAGERCVKPRVRDISFSTSCCTYLLPAAFVCARVVRPYLDHGVASKMRCDLWLVSMSCVCFSAGKNTWNWRSGQIKVAFGQDAIHNFPPLCSWKEKSIMTSS